MDGDKTTAPQKKGAWRPGPNVGHLAQGPYLRVVGWAGLGGRVMVGRGFIVVEERRVGQVRWRVPRRLHVALRLLERRPGVGVARHHLRAAVAQRTVVVALEGRKDGRTEGGKDVDRLMVD